jgi:hypothetical protein
MKGKYKLDEELKLYLNTGYYRTRLLWELIGNSDRIINSVYIFKNFDEYCRQLSSDKQEDKLEVFWTASYYERLIDYIKITVAFETLNKALLVQRGILIHKIDHRFNKQLKKRQDSGKPIELTEFYENNYTIIDSTRRKATLNGLKEYLPTINFSHTLNEDYQSILNLDETLVTYLKEINQKRNRLHLYSDFKGAFTVQNHIDKWKFIKECSTTTIRNELKRITEELNSSQKLFK